MRGSEVIARSVLNRLKTIQASFETADEWNSLEENSQRRVFVIEAMALKSLLKQYARKSVLMAFASNYLFVKEAHGFHVRLDSFPSISCEELTELDTWKDGWSALVTEQQELLFGLVCQLVESGTISIDKNVEPAALMLLDTLVKCEKLTVDHEPLEPNYLENLKQVYRKLVSEKSPEPKPSPWYLPREVIQRPRQTLPFSPGTMGVAEEASMLWKGKHRRVLVKELNFPTIKLRDILEPSEITMLEPIAKWYGLPDHPNVIKLLGAHHVSAPVFIVSELAVFRTFMDYFANNGHKLLWRLFLQAATGLQHLHKHDILHTNLKITNLLVDSNDNRELNPNGLDVVAKVCDFGLKVVSNVSARSKTRIARELDEFRWLAPEVLGIAESIQQPVLSPAGDVFSLGRCILAAVTGQTPYREIPEDEFILKIVRGERFDLPTVKQLNTKQRRLIDDMCSPKPKERPTLERVIERLQELADDEAIRERSTRVTPSPTG